MEWEEQRGMAIISQQSVAKVEVKEITSSDSVIVVLWQDALQTTDATYIQTRSRECSSK